MSKRKLVNWVAVVVLAIGVTIASPFSASANVPSITNGYDPQSPVRVSASSDFSSVTFHLGYLWCNPESSGSCQAGGGAYSNIADIDSSRSVSGIAWRYSLNGGPWTNLEHTCRQTVVNSWDTWCPSNWFYDTLKISNLEVGTVVRAQPALRNIDGLSEWLDGVYGSGTAAFASVQTDNPSTQFTSNPDGKALTGELVAFSGADSTTPSGQITKFEWDFDGDGAYELDSGNNPAVSHTFKNAATYNVSLRVTSAQGMKTSTSKNFHVFLSPPAGEPGMSINGGDIFTNSTNVTLKIVWPSFATAVRISNDGGFATSKTITKSLDGSISWQLDNSLVGIYTKNVYLRFSGDFIDSFRTYSDDIILDNTAPVISSAKAQSTSSASELVVPASYNLSHGATIQNVSFRKLPKAAKPVTKATRKIRLSLKAKDNLSGISRLQVSRYSNGSHASTSSFRSSIVLTATKTTKKLYVRVIDGAGNWSRWKALNIK